MLWMTLVTLLTVWGVGVVSAHPFGGLIHVLLIVAIAIVFVRFIQDRAKTAAMTVQAAAIGSELAEGGADLAGPRWPGRTRGPAGPEDTIAAR
jgi:hypothetical protein